MKFTDNTHRFSGKADVYSEARPEYPEAVYDMLFEEYGFAGCGAVADFGAGTGKFTRGLVGRGCKVYAIEPNSDMLSALEKRFEGVADVQIIRSAAEHTPLSENSVGAAVTAQAFHWFEVQAFRRECLRVLDGQGLAAIVYNTRRPSPLHERTFDILRRFCPDFKGFSGGYDRRKIDVFFGGEYNYRTIDNTLYYDGNTFIKRCLSSSYALTERDENFEEFRDALKSVFDEYAQGGVLVFPNMTEIYIGRIRQ